MHICHVTAISGFLQRRGGVGAHNGMDSLWLRRLRKFLGPRFFIDYLPWWHNWEHQADFIWELTRNATDHSIAIFGYSYGGSAATWLARKLQERGLVVRNMVLSDPVKHHGWHFSFMRKRPSAFSLCPCPKIHVRNVQQLEFWYQNSNRPKGHRVYLDGLRIRGRRVHGASHVYMDSHPAFHDRCEEIAQQYSLELEKAA